MMKKLLTIKNLEQERKLIKHMIKKTCWWWKLKLMIKTIYKQDSRENKRKEKRKEEDKRE